MFRAVRLDCRLCTGARQRVSHARRALSGGDRLASPHALSLPLGLRRCLGLYHSTLRPEDVLRPSPERHMGTQTTCFVAGIRGVATGVADAIAVLIDSTGQLGTVSSSKDVKHDIEDMDDQSADVLKLRPVTFVYNGDASEKKQYGLIAEEVDEIFPDIVVKNQEGNPETIQYHILPALLLNEMKKQHATIEQMNNVIARLQEQVEEFIGRVKNLENKA